MYMLIFLERSRWGERERKRNIDGVPSACTPTRDRTHNLLVCRRIFQPTEPFSQGDSVIF